MCTKFGGHGLSSFRYFAIKFPFWIINCSTWGQRKEMSNVYNVHQASLLANVPLDMRTINNTLHRAMLRLIVYNNYVHMTNITCIL